MNKVGGLPEAARVTRPARRLAMHRATPYLFLGPLVLFLALLTVYPTIFLVQLSLSSYFMGDPLSAMQFVGLANFASVLGDVTFWQSLLVTAEYMVGSVVLEIVLGVGVALLLYREFPLRGLARAIVLLPMMATPVIVGVMWKALYNVEFGLINYFLGFLGVRPNWLGSQGLALPAVILVDVWQWTPFVALIVLAALEGVSPELLEAAQIDGASGWATFWRVLLPLASPALFVAVLLRSIDSFKIFDNLFAMTNGGPGLTTQTLSLLIYKTNYVFLDAGRAAALAIVMLVLANVFGQVMARRVRGQLQVRSAS